MTSSMQLNKPAQLVINVINSRLLISEAVTTTPDDHPLDATIGQLAAHLDTLFRLFVFNKAQSSSPLKETVLETYLKDTVARNRFKASLELNQANNQLYTDETNRRTHIMAALGSFFDFLVPLTNSNSNADLPPNDQIVCIQPNSNIVQFVEGFLVKPIIDSTSKLYIDDKADDMAYKELLAIAISMGRNPNGNLLISESCQRLLEQNSKQDDDQSLAILTLLSHLSKYTHNEQDISLIQQTCSTIISNELKSNDRNDKKLCFALHVISQLQHVNCDSKLLWNLNNMVRDKDRTDEWVAERKLHSLKILSKIKWPDSGCQSLTYETLKACVLNPDEEQWVRSYAVLALSQIKSVNETPEEVPSLYELIDYATGHLDNDVSTAAALTVANIARNNPQLKAKTMETLWEGIKTRTYESNPKILSLFIDLATPEDLPQIADYIKDDGCDPSLKQSLSALVMKLTSTQADTDAINYVGSTKQRIEAAIACWNDQQADFDERVSALHYLSCYGYPASNILLDLLAKANDRDSVPIMENLLAMGSKIAPTVMAKIQEVNAQNHNDPKYLDKLIELLLATLERADQFLEQIYVPNGYETRFISPDPKLINASEKVEPALVREAKTTLNTLSKDLVQKNGDKDVLNRVRKGRIILSQVAS